MDNKRFGKAGIAPIVATLVLVVFAVVFGVVIMNFGRAAVQQESECTIDIGLEFSEIGGQTEICFDRAKEIIRFTVENGVNMDVSGVTVNVIGTEKAESFALSDAKMSKAAVYLGDVGYNVGSNGEIRQIKIVPKIVPFDEEVVCSKQALTAENVRDC